MFPYTLYFATNRNHLGPDQWHPTGYGKTFSDDGHENLRFGYLTLQADENKVKSYLAQNVDKLNAGDGGALADYFKGLASGAKIEAYEETLNKLTPDTEQSLEKFGSTEFFADVKGDMEQNSDALVYIHGFNDSWEAVVGSALSLQEMVNLYPKLGKKVVVILFSWPSDGEAIPFYSYFSDRADARDSGNAIGRGFLRLRDFFDRLYAAAKNGKDKLCGQSIHLLCHSMGNYALQNAIDRMEEFIQTPSLPRLFENVFMCAADVDDDVLEQGEPLGRLDELTRNISVYFNRQDKAMITSETTKGNAERLGYNGCAHPYNVHSKVYQVDCTAVVPGGVFATQHSYYLLGDINRDIAQSIAGVQQDDPQRLRSVSSELPNTWKMT